VALIGIGGYDVVAITETWLQGDQGWELARVDWERILEGKMVEQQWQEFLGVIRETQQYFISRKKKQTKGRTRQAWLTREVRNSIKAK